MLDCLRAQMLLIDCMAECLTWHWEQSRIDPPPLDDKTSKQLLGTVTFFLKQNTTFSSSSDASQEHIASFGASPAQGGMQPQRNSESSVFGGTASPPQLTARQEMTPSSLSSPNAFSKRFRRTSIPTATPSSLGGNDASSVSSTGPSYSPLLTADALEKHARQKTTYSRTLEKHDTIDIMHHIIISCASVVGYVSASRWDIVLAKLRAKLSQWCNDTGTPVGDEVPDMSEVHILEFCYLNDVRLASVLSELTRCWTNLKKSVQPIVSDILRMVLERFMRNNPKVFHAMYEDGKRLAFAGQPEALFDAIFSTADTLSRRSAMWPTLGALLPLCPEIVMQIAMGGGDTRSPLLSKKVLYLDGLRKAVRASSNQPPGCNTPSSSSSGSKTQAHISNLGSEARLALLCYIQICTAASYSTPIPTRPLPPLHILANEMETEVRSRLIDPSKPCAGPDGTTDADLMRDLMVCIGRLNLQTVKIEVVPRLLGLQAINPLKLAGIHALADLLSYSDIDKPQLRNAVVLPIGRLLHQTVLSTLSTNATGQLSLLQPGAHAKQIMDDLESERNEVILAVLDLIEVDPHLILYSPATGASSPNLTGVPLQQPSQLTKFRPYSLAQTLGLLNCLMQEDNHPYIRRRTVDVLLLLASYIQTKISDTNFAGQEEFADLAKLLYSHMDALVVAASRPCLAKQDSLEDDRAALGAFLCFCTQISHVASKLSLPIQAMRTVAHFAEVVVLLNLMSADPETRNLSLALIAVTGKSAIGTALSGNLPELAKAILIDQGNVIGGIVAQTKRITKLFAHIKSHSRALALSWMHSYKRWRKLGALYGVQGLVDEVKGTVGGIDISYVQTFLPSEVSPP